MSLVKNPTLSFDSGFNTHLLQSNDGEICYILRYRNGYFITRLVDDMVTDTMLFENEKLLFAWLVSWEDAKTLYYHDVPVFIRQLNIRPGQVYSVFHQKVMVFCEDKLTYCLISEFGTRYGDWGTKEKIEISLSSNNAILCNTTSIFN